MGIDDQFELEVSCCCSKCRPKPLTIKIKGQNFKHRCQKLREQGWTIRVFLIREPPWVFYAPGHKKAEHTDSYENR